MPAAPPARAVSAVPQGPALRRRVHAGQDVDYELPMQPITMMRNTLGKEEGGSGVPMDRERYTASVAFWSGHAPLK
eukprot:5577017-Prymnesium_polylepis.1